MATNVVLNSVTYSIPAEGDSNWGPSVSNYLIAIASACLQKSGGSFTLTAETDFGATYGLKAVSFKSRAANPASTGVLRLGHGEEINWRNQDNTGDLKLSVDAANLLTYNGAALGLAGDLTTHINDATGAHAASAISSVPAGNLAATDVQAALDELQTDLDTRATAQALTDHLNDLTAAHAASAIGSTPSGNLAATDVQAALDELQSDIDTRATSANLSAHQNSGTAHTAANLVNVPSGNLAATDVQAALNELQSDIDTRATAQSLTDHLNDTTGAHAASAVSFAPTGSISSTDAQAALAELDSDVTTHTGASTGVHGVTGSVVGTSDVQVLTSKDFDGGTASNTSRLTIPKATKSTLDGLTRKEATLVYATDLKKAYVDDGSSLVAVGSGSGGGVNYVTDGDAESGTAIGTSYGDGAAVPVDGTGGSPTATWTVSSSSPLAGVNSFVFTPGGLGNGRNIPFTISRESFGKVLEIKFSYEIGTYTSYTDGDLQVWVKTPSGAIVQPVGFKIVKASGPQQFKATFQTEVSGTSYALLIHQATAATTYGSVKFDSISVGPQSTVNATLITDWQSYTPTISSGTGTVTNYTTDFYWRRVGQNIELRGTIQFTGAVGTWSQLRFTPPAGISTVLNANEAEAAVGYWNSMDWAVQNYGLGYIFRHNGSLFALRVNNAAGTYLTGADTTQSVPFAFGANDSITIAPFSLPVTGWGSSTVSASESDGRVVAARAYRSGTAQSVTASTATDIVFNAISHDTHGTFNTSTGIYTVSVPGIYRVSVSCYCYDVVTGESFNLYIVKNSTATTLRFVKAEAGDFVTDITDTIQCNAGDTIKAQIDSTSDTSYSIMNNATTTFISIERISGSSAIVAGETVAARYYTAAGQSIPNSTGTTVVFGSKVYDTHGFYNASTGIGTIPVSGKYRVSALIEFTTNTNGIRAIDLNGSQFCGLGERAASSVYARIGGSTTIDFLAGQTFKLDAYQTAGVSVSLTTGGAFNYFSIERIGN